jgi:hypothetical protein
MDQIHFCIDVSQRWGHLAFQGHTRNDPSCLFCGSRCCPGFYDLRKNREPDGFRLYEAE